MQICLFLYRKWVNFIIRYIKTNKPISLITFIYIYILSTLSSAPLSVSFFLSFFSLFLIILPFSYYIIPSFLSRLNSQTFSTTFSSASLSIFFPGVVSSIWPLYIKNGFACSNNKPISIILLTVLSTGAKNILTVFPLKK